MASIDVPAPMAGSIMEILVSPGDTVAEGAELLIMESMKMEIPVESPLGGTIVEVVVSVADLVEEGQVLFRIER